LNIGKQIVKRQREFMEKGVSHLKPLIMAQVAETVGVHETTVSRAVSGKYMQTPQGVFEMKFFFTGGLQTASGENVSNTSVKDMIAEIFKNEAPGKPLSDHEVVKMLSEKGIVIARRTVAKYRLELNILPSNLRRFIESPFARRFQFGLRFRLQVLQFRPQFFLGFPAHPVNEQNAVQVIHFMLDGAREQAAAPKFKPACLFGSTPSRPPTRGA